MLAPTKTLTIALALGLGCASPKPATNTAPAALAASEAPKAVTIEGPMWASAKSVVSTCDEVARRSQQRIAALVAKGSVRTDDDLKPYNRALFDLDRVQVTAELIAAVHPENSVRGAAEVCSQALSKAMTDISRDRALYDVLQATNPSAMPKGAQRFLSKVLKGFLRAGADKDKETRSRLRTLDAEIVRLRQDFSRRIRESRGWIAVPQDALAGLPKDFIENRPPDWQGLVELSTSYTDFFPVVTYAHDEGVRRNLYRRFLNRAHPENDQVLKRLLGARAEYAQLLGFDSWTAYMADDNMIGSADAIDRFIRDVSQAARPKMQEELKDLLRRKKKDDPKATAIEVWDRLYYVQRIRDEKYGFDAREVRKYFSSDQVVQGGMEFFGELFGLRFEREAGLLTWHHSVTVWNVYEGDWLVGRFFLDMYPRPDKYGHASMFPMGVGHEDGNLPTAALVCNFPDPRRTTGPALLDHKQVLTFFHEFGHIVHYLLATSSPWANQAGMTVEADFREAPALLFEEWAWKTEVLQRFAKHVDTGEPIPAELVEKMRASQEFGKGVKLMRQVYLTALSAYLHQADPSKLDLSWFQEKMMRRYSPYAYPEGTHGYASFGHLEVFSSMYYVYQWSLSLVKDLWTRFEEQGLVSPKLAKAYADAVLRPGGSKDAARLAQDFLGRPPNLEAYRAWLGARTGEPAKTP